ARFELIPATLSSSAQWQRVQAFMDREGLQFPIVLKPDVGERGNGVAIIRSKPEAVAYLAATAEDVIAQEYIAGIEFGLFYRRFPDQATGEIVSITEKRQPV